MVRLMSRLFESPPFGDRDDIAFLREMNELSAMHLRNCSHYRSIWPLWKEAGNISELPYVHVGLFKHLTLSSIPPGKEGPRSLWSSGTSGFTSKIVLDDKSSQLHALSVQHILEAMIGSQKRVLLVLDNSESLRQPGHISARTAAALSLKHLAKEIHFIASDVQGQPQIDWGRIEALLSREEEFLVYGFTWMLWQAWGLTPPIGRVADLLKQKKIYFFHSGGWKRLENLTVNRTKFDETLLGTCRADSKVFDFYGLVEQAGIIYPLCEAGNRHVPRWADIIVRDPCSLKPLYDEIGMIQLLNVLAYSSPCQSVLTEDTGQIVRGDCPCGWKGRIFKLSGRIPKAEQRGCSNVES
jgi:hypothetical protein